MFVQHNLPGTMAGRNMTRNKGKLGRNLERLSSGYRINRAGDDAAGLAISEGLRWEIRGVEQAKQNIQDGVGMVQTADGAMQEINAMLNRARQLSTEAANGTYNEASRAALQEEIDEIQAEIARITVSTEFDDVKVFSQDPARESIIANTVEIYPVTFLPNWVKGGDAMEKGAQVEKYTTQQSYKWKDDTGQEQTGDVKVVHAAATLDFSGLNADNKSQLIGTGFYCTCLTCSNHYSVKFTTGNGKNTVKSGNHWVYEIGIDNVNTGSELVEAVVKGLGASSGSGIANPGNHYTMLRANSAGSATLVIYDDRSSEAPPALKAPDGNAVEWIGWGPSDHQAFNVSVATNKDKGKFGRGVAYEPGTWSPPPEPPTPDLFFQIGASAQEQMDIFLPRVSVGSLKIRGVSVMTQKQANEAMEIYGGAIDYLDAERGRMGAYQNRLEHTLRSNEVSRENLTQAESRIRDTDMAEEMVDYTKNSILFQASQSMLAQANMLPEHVIKLLG